MFRKAKRNYYENLDLNDINDNKILWTTSLFCNKIKSVESIMLGEIGKLVTDKKKVANIFNDFFCKYSHDFRDKYRNEFLNTTNISHNPIENAIYKYENHPGAIAIKNHMKGTNSSFSFQTVTKQNTAKLIANLDNKLKSMDIPTKLVKNFSWLFSSFIASNVIKCIN